MILVTDAAGKAWLIKPLARCVACGERVEAHPIPPSWRAVVQPLVPGCVGCYNPSDLQAQ